MRIKGIYCESPMKTTFVGVERIPEMLQELEETLAMSAEELEWITEDVYELVSNYDLTKEYVWIRIAKDYEGAPNTYAIDVCKSPLVDKSLDDLKKDLKAIKKEVKARKKSRKAFLKKYGDFKNVG